MSLPAANHPGRESGHSGRQRSSGARGTATAQWEPGTQGEDGTFSDISSGEGSMTDKTDTYDYDAFGNLTLRANRSSFWFGGGLDNEL
jgi:hypothetical protein